MADPNKAWSAQDKAKFAQGAQESPPMDWQNLKNSLGLGAQAADKPTDAGAGLMGPDRKAIEQGLARRLRQVNID